MITRESTIQEVVASNPLLELVLERFDTPDWRTSVTLESHCREHHLHVDFMVEVLRAFEEPASFNADNFSQYPIPVILDYLYRTHDYYLHRRVGEIEQSIDALTEGFGQAYPLLFLLPRYFSQYALELNEHIAEEEKDLFPIATKLAESKEAVLPVHIELAAHHQAHHQQHHLDEDLALIRHILERHCPEVLSLLPFKILLTQLSAFERDLYIHEMVEDEVLWPQILRMAGKGLA